MNQKLLAALLLVGAAQLSGTARAQDQAAAAYPGYELVWSDEFGGTQLSGHWQYNTGTGKNGWGNAELQYYQEENVSVAEGVLVIEARQQQASDQQYTSGRILTAGQQQFQYGRIDLRAKMPQGKGMWPALWMLGANHKEVGWPACGEIDIMEMVGGAEGDSTVHGTAHWDDDGTWPQASYGGHLKLDEPLSAGFHLYSIVWDEQKIQWLCDNQPYHAIDIAPEELAEFRAPFFLIINLAVGGRWPGSPDDTTVFPQQLVVDFVRVYQRP